MMLLLDSVVTEAKGMINYIQRSIAKVFIPDQSQAFHITPQNLAASLKLT